MPTGEAGGQTRKPRFGLGTRILIGMVIGAAVGAVAGESILAIEPIGDLFLRLLLVTAVPLVVANLLAGLTALTDLRTFGRLALKIVVYYTVTTAFALLLGLGAAHLLKPGAGMTLSAPPQGEPGSVPSLGSVLLDLVPTNIVEAFATGNVAQLVVFAALLAVTTLLLPEAPRDRLRTLYADLAALFRKLVDLILIVAPIGIGALMAVTAGRFGAQLFGPLARFLAAVWGAQLAMVVVYVTLLFLIARRRPFAFLRDGGPLWATAAATTSSLASLSVALDVAERMRLPRPIYSFTLPLGAQINKDGTAIMLSAVLLFTAQAAGMTFTPVSLISVLLIGLLLSEGSGGIPGGGLVVALIFVRAFDLPLEIAAIVGGIYRLVDMGNTTVNVMGDMVGTCIVAHTERATERVV